MQSINTNKKGAQWLSGWVLDLRRRGHGFEPHCVYPWARHINPSLVLVQPRKTRPFITERLLMGRKDSDQTKQTQQINIFILTHLIKRSGSYFLGPCTYVLVCMLLIVFDVQFQNNINHRRRLPLVIRFLCQPCWTLYIYAAHNRKLVFR